MFEIEEDRASGEYKVVEVQGCTSTRKYTQGNQRLGDNTELYSTIFNNKVRRFKPVLQYSSHSHCILDVG